MSIRILPNHVANRIAAGEVIERPASVVKELIENAIDADPKMIEIVVRGLQLEQIKVIDDGFGMALEDLALSLQRHATSKLPGDDISNVCTLGYRGEALPSISSVADIHITSRRDEADCAFVVTAHAGVISKPRPCSGRNGTIVDVMDLFSRHPARQKFQKSQRAEAAAIREVISAAAMSHPEIDFKFTINGSEGRYPSRSNQKARLADVLGNAFTADGVEVNHEADEVLVTGFASIPSASRADASGIRVSVNGRPVIDKLMRSAVQAAYAALIGEGRHPQAFINLTLPGNLVDINMHPRKAEVRFMRPQDISAIISEAVTKALDQSGFLTPSGVPDLAKKLAQSSLDLTNVDDPKRLPLGKFVHQINGSWLLSETVEGLVIIDQHAAHERVILERLKGRLSELTEDLTVLPTPVDARVTYLEAAAIDDCKDTIRSLGFDVVTIGTLIHLLQVPSVLSDCDPKILLDLIVKCSIEGTQTELLKQAMWDKLANAACKAAIKAGQSLDAERANLLLREIEATPNASYCNHGRPTMVFLKDKDIATLFGRS